MPNRVLVDRASVGKPPKKIRCNNIESLRFTIHDFKNREEKGCNFIRSPILKAHGYKWRIRVYPREEESGREWTSCYLEFVQEGNVRVSFGFFCKDCKRDLPPKSCYFSQSGEHVWGEDLILREDVDQVLEEDGSLVIEADIQIISDDRRICYPRELQQNQILVKLYRDISSETSDVAFSVGGTIYMAHKNILSLRCRELYEISKEEGNSYDENLTPILIDSVRGGIFKSVLEFVYTVKAPEIVNEETTVELLVAADRFDCIDLKLWAESVLVETFLNAKRAVALLILADSLSCALLKEKAIDLVLGNPKTIGEAREDWSKFEESNRLLKELLMKSLAMTHKCLAEHNTNGTNSNRGSKSEMVDEMDVMTLRWELEKADLKLDGSREVLVDRLKSYRKR